jgi:hypothetical protein
VKLLALLCLVGAFQVSASTLPFFNTVDHTSSAEWLVIPVVRFKNNHFGEGNTVTIFPSLDLLCCPVAAFTDWKTRTAYMHTGVHKCRLIFTLNSSAGNLHTEDCATILRKVATKAGLNIQVLTPKSFCKSGVMASLAVGIQPDTIMKLGGWASAETFWHHYVSCTIPESYTNLIFNVASSPP